MKYPKNVFAYALVLIGMFVLFSCDPSGSNSSVAAPSALSYSEDTAIFAKGVQEILDDEATVTGTSVKFTIAPALPSGLVLDSNTGRISGKPTVSSPVAPYMVTASNSGGSITDTIQLAVMTLDTTLSGLVQHIFDQNCADDCHKPGGSGYLQTGGTTHGGLDLTRGNALASLLNHRTYEDSTHTPTLRLKTLSPDSSYLYRKIVDSIPKYGLRMPFDGPPYLTSDQITIIKRWIEKGLP